jgi:hypothetical protein
MNYLNTNVKCVSVKTSLLVIYKNIALNGWNFNYVLLEY